MAGQHQKKKRPLDALKARSMGKPVKRQKHYHSDSEDEVAATSADFDAVNLLSDDDDILGAAVDDGASSGADSDDDAPKSKNGSAKSKLNPKSKKQKPARQSTKDAPSSSESDHNSASDDDDDAFSSDEDNDSSHPSKPKPKSKRNDPAAFATSLQKILGTKLSTTRRADPVLARSAEAQESSKRIADTALDAKARKLLREQKRIAQEKGRVKDVLIATNQPFLDRTTGELVEEGGEQETTASIVESERKLRKVAQRGVVKLFNAVRAAQVKALEAEREVAMKGIASSARRQDKVTEMSRKGFLDLIASGGGGLKKGPIVEA